MKRFEVMINRLTKYINVLEDMFLYDEDWRVMKEAFEKGELNTDKPLAWLGFVTKRDVIVDKINAISNKFKEDENYFRKTYYMSVVHDMYINLISRYCAVMEKIPNGRFYIDKGN